MTITPSLRLSKKDLGIITSALCCLSKNSDVADLKVRIDNEYKILRSHTCTEYHYDCPICNRDNGNQ